MKNNQPKTKSALSIASKIEDTTTIKLLNPKKEELTPVILKIFPGYENLLDEEAEEKCATIKTFARLLLQHIASLENNTDIDNQQVVSSESQENSVISINKNKTKPKAA